MHAEAQVHYNKKDCGMSEDWVSDHKIVGKYKPCACKEGIPRS